MKKILSLVLVLTMVLGSFGFAFAAEETVPDSVKRVHAEGIFGVGGLRLNDVAKRVELATLVLRLHGFEDSEIEALATASDFSDVPATYWGAPYVGLSVQEGLFTGDTGANTFRPEADASYAELLVVLLRALGYGEDLAGLEWPAGYVAKAAEVGIDVNLTTAANAAVTRLVVGATIDKALDLVIKDGTATLGQKLGIDGTEVVPEPPAELDVDSVSADNLKQVIVEFNQDVTDNEAVENLKNYDLLDDKGKSYSKIEDVEIDGDVVTLTLIKEAKNQTTYSLVIAKDVVGTKLTEEVRFDDFTIPTALEAEVIGIRDIIVRFSEPVKEVSRTDFAVETADGKTINIREAKVQKNNTEAHITLRSDLKDGDEIVVTAKNTIEDFASYKIGTTKFDVEVIEDNSEIEIVGYRKASEAGITLIFNKNIQFKDEKKNFEKVYHTNSRNIDDGNIVNVVNGNEISVELDSDALMPKGTVYIFVEGDTVKDFWGNVNKRTIRYEVEVTPDTKVPVIEKIEVADTARALTVTFDKALDSKSAKDKDNYEVTYESSGKEASKISSVTHVSSKVVRINLTSKLDSGKYVLEISDLEDFLGNTVVNTSKSFTVTADGLTEVKLNFYPAVGTSTESSYVIDFGRSMDTEDDRYSVLDLANYSIWFDGKLITLEDVNAKSNYYVDITIADDNDKIVEIVIDDRVTSNSRLFIGSNGAVNTAIEIARVKDANGVLSAVMSITPSPEANELKIDKAELIDRETVKITFTRPVDKFVLADFTFAGATNFTTTNASVDVDGKVVTVTLNNELTGTAAAGLTITTKASGLTTVSTFGDVLVANETKPVGDKVAPEIKEISDEYDVTAVLGAGTNEVNVTINFTEDMKEGSFSLTSFTFDGKDATAVAYNYDSVTLTYVISNVEAGIHYTLAYTGRVTDDTTNNNALDFDDAISVQVVRPTLTGITISGDVNGTVGTPVALAVVATPGKADTRVTWVSSDTSVATVNANGVVTIAAGAQVGQSVVITATSVVDTTKIATHTITVVQ